MRANAPFISELMSTKQIHGQTKLIGNVIASHYKDTDRPPLFIVILNGAVPFSKLLFHFTCREGLSFEVKSIGVRRYKGMEGGEIECYKLPDMRRIVGRDVLIVEDIVDKGITALHIISEVNKHHPKSVQICSLVDKPLARIVPIDVAFTCFVCAPELFLVGFGLDLDGDFRELDYIGEVHD